MQGSPETSSQLLCRLCRKGQECPLWMSAVCVDEQNIFISAVTCPGFLEVTDAGAACSW